MFKIKRLSQCNTKKKQNKPKKSINTSSVQRKPKTTITKLFLGFVVVDAAAAAAAAAVVVVTAFERLDELVHRDQWCCEA